jgi:large subunit ribosomal protein L4
MELSLALPGKKAGKEKVSVSDEAFGKEYNEALVHQTVVTLSSGCASRYCAAEDTF